MSGVNVIIQGIIAGIPFFDEVFAQLGCEYVKSILCIADRPI